MKTFQRFCATTTLTLILAVSVFAGEMQTGFVSPIKDQTDSAITTSLDPLTEIMLALVQGVLGQF